MKSNKTSRVVSFKSAFSGIFYNLRHETNFKIQLIVAALVIIAGFFFSVSFAKWVILLLTIGAVLSFEAMNTAVEKICDRFMPENDPMVKIIKDSAAAAVLIISISAACVGLVIFVPYLMELMNISL
jgi:diacylglycerol kinase